MFQRELSPRDQGSGKEPRAGLLLWLQLAPKFLSYSLEVV